LEAPLGRVGGGGKVWAMFDGIEVRLVPRFLVVLLYGLEVSLLSVCHAGFRARARSASLWEK